MHLYAKEAGTAKKTLKIILRAASIWSSVPIISFVWGEVNNANRTAREANMTGAGEMTDGVKSVFSERENLKEGIL